MTFCMRDGGAWVKVGQGTLVDIGGKRRRVSHRWLAGLAEAERTALGAVELVASAAPAGQKVLAEGPVADVGGVPTQTWLTEPYTDDEVEGLRAAVVLAVKREAQRRILLVMTAEQQSNALALGQQLITEHGPDPAAWPEAERAQYLADGDRWARIRDLRAASNDIEAALPASAAGLLAFDAAGAAWPE
jgi:hypothetical protein